MTSTAVSVGFVGTGSFTVEILLSEVIVTDNSVVDNDSNVVEIDSGVVGVVVVVVVEVVVVVVDDVDVEDGVVEMDGFFVLREGMIRCVTLLPTGRLVVEFFL